jgi:hypothetical protein
MKRNRSALNALADRRSAFDFNFQIRYGTPTTLEGKRPEINSD